ncbi:hypothetical protein BCR37DRAFT_390486 [Protomyces lactucae-debilis]|uniref:CUE domain-containing protein n=1 Tax=Protomyces lactucae-debilis TaxID=2754530 RepID=A0A1Y2FXU5_PROLT|nr:uncharacterized protein BCR37DRAFT_390486 [Protomyces lactucae-debilis]ORY87986.1 hypothetical protein BCR37DRAFT_390486 [Protomyces lactucae-debilis]
MRPRLARVLASLTGPVTEQAQQSFLQDLKSSFRQRIQHEAAPVAHVVDRHLNDILGFRSPRVARSPSTTRATSVPADKDMDAVARQHFIDGSMTPAAVRDLLTAAQTPHDLSRIQHWATKAGPASEIARHPDLSAKLATKLIQLGQWADASPLIARHSKAFIADSAHHALIVLYASERGDLQEAFSWHAQLETHPRHRRAVLRTLLRASVKKNDLQKALECLRLDGGCCLGQETGLARWLCERQRPSEAFTVLQRAEPQRAREAVVGLMIAQQLVQGTGDALLLCRQVLTWTEGFSIKQSSKQYTAGRNNYIMSASADIQTLKAVFGDSWSEQDLQQVLQESRGDVDLATDRILSGKATKFGEVTKKKDKQAARKNNNNVPQSALFQPFLNAADRGRGRGRGGASARGGRGGDATCGRGRGRGGASSGEPRAAFKKDHQASGGSTRADAAQEPSAAVETTSTWDVEPVAPTTDDWDMAPAPGQASADWDEPVTSVLDAQPEPVSTDSWLESVATQQETQAKPKSRIIDKNSKSSWASIAKPPPAAPKAVVQKQASSTATAPAPTTTAPLTEENLEAATENQPDLPQPPAATVRSIQGEPATGPSSIVGAPGTPSGNIVPPGMKVGGQQRTGTPLGGRKLNQNQAVIMPGTETQPATKLSLQFGSLDIEDDAAEHGQTTGEYGKQASAEQQRPQQGDKLYDNFGPGYGNYGMPAQPAGPYPGFGQGHAQYGGMSSFYGGQEPPRPSPFGDYYGQGQQQQPGQASPVQSGHAATATGRAGAERARYGEQTGASPIASHMTHQQGLAAPIATGSPAQHGVPQAYAGYPQGYPNPNPYAYYGYAFPQQQPYGAYGQPSMYGQQPPQQQPAQRGTSGGVYSASGYLGQQQGQAGSTHSLGTSQDRFERSTGEYQQQRQGNGSQQGQQQQGQYGTHDDFLGGRSASQQQQQQGNGNGTEESYKGYATTESTPSRDAAKLAQGYGGYPQQQQQQQYGNHAQYAQQHGQQTQYAQYGQYGARGGWNQQTY